MPRTPPGQAARPARGGLPRRPCAAPRRPVGTTDPRRVHPRSRRATGSLARMGARRGHRRVRPARRGRALGPSGRDGQPRAGRPARHHRHPGGLGEVAGVPAARAHRGPGGRHRALPRADPGPGRGPAPGGQRARPARGPPGRGGRGHAHGGAGLGPLARQLPADHPGHAASDAAAPACPVERVFPPPALHRRGRVPHLPGSVRLARGPGAAQAAPHRRLPRRRRISRQRISGPRISGQRTGLPARLRHRQRARQLRVPAHRAAGRGGDRERGAVRAGHLRPVGAAAHQHPRRGRRAGAAQRHQ